MKLLVISHSCVAPVNQEFYAELQRVTGWEVVLVIPGNWIDEYGRTCGPKRWPAFPGRVIFAAVRLPGNIILHTYRTSLAAIIREVNPDTIYVNHEPYAAATFQAYWANARSGRQRPIGFYSCQNIFKQYPVPFRWGESWVLKSSSFAFPISVAVEEVFRRKGYRGPTTVLPLAVDPNIHYPRPDAALAKRDLIGDQIADTVLIGFVGRFVREKGLTTLVRALGHLVDLNWRLAMVGAGPMEAELRQLALSSGVLPRITFTGFIQHTEVPKLLSAMDLLVLPSETQPNWREQFGRVVLEAMACGTPVLGSDSGEIPRLIADTGGGLVFRERDPDGLAEGLRHMIVDPHLRFKLAASGRAIVNAKYTLAQAVQSFARALDLLPCKPRIVPMPLRVTDRCRQ